MVDEKAQLERESVTRHGRGDSASRPAASPGSPEKRDTLAFFGYFVRNYRRTSATATFLLLLANVFEGISLVAIFPLLEQLGGDRTDQSYLSDGIGRVLATVGLELSLRSVLGLIVAGMFLKAGLTWLARRQAGFAVVHIATDLRLQLMRGLFRARWRYFTEKPVGDLANALSAEVNAAGSAFYGGVNLVGQCFHALVYVIVIAIVSWQATVFAIVAGALIIVVLARFVRSIRRVGNKQAQVTRSFVRRLVDAIRNIKPVRSMGSVAPFESHLEGEAEELRRAMNTRISSYEALTAAQEPLLALVIALGLLLAVGLFDYGLTTLTMLGFLFWRVVTQINRLQTAYSGMVHLEPYFWSLHDMIEETRNEEERWPGCAAVPDGILGIEFDCVSFAHDDREVLADVSFDVAPGDIVAISGPSGAGKTTLVDMVLGLHRAKSGTIRIGEIPLEDLALNEWRAAIGYVAQEPILMNDTVQFNVTLGDTTMDESDVRIALKAAGAWEFVRQLKGELAAPVGEGGSRLSAGQRQRILMARALVRKPRLLILDEVTAALDSENEASIIDTLLELRGRVTMLAVTHRPALMEAANSVVELAG